MSHRIAAAAAIVCIISCMTPVMATVITYDTPGALTGSFNLNTDAGVAIKYTQVEAGGLGGSGAVDFLNTTDAQHTTAVLNTESFSLAGDGDSVTVSQFVLRQDAIISMTPWTQLGIVSDPTERMDGGLADSSYASVRFDPVDGAVATDISLMIETKLANGSRARLPMPITASLEAGHWYRMSATFGYDSESMFAVSTVLEDWGTDGSAYEATVLMLDPTSVPLAGPDQVNGDDSVWGAYRSFHEGGADLHDNFSVVPEPTSLAVLLTGTLATVLRRRRHHQAR